MNKKYTKQLFILILAMAFMGLLVFNVLTPFMSDDFYYAPGQYRSIAGVADKTWELYMTWNGRLVPQFIMTWCLSLPLLVFDVLNSLVFIILVLLIYWNVVDGAKEYDIRSLLVILLCMWLFIVSPGQTILWTSGSCNYLWATVISLGFLTLTRYILCKDLNTKSKTAFLLCIVMLVLGVCAGWCNENTSGGVLLLVLFAIAEKFFIYTGKQKIRDIIKVIPSWCYCGITGLCIGLLGLVLSPGGKIRLAGNLEEEEQSGLFAYVGRFLKLNEYVREDFAVIGIITILLVLYSIYTKKDIKKMVYTYALLICAVITVYVLLLTTTPMDRALFGSEIFVFIAIARMLRLIDDNDGIGLKTIINSLIVVAIIASLYLFARDGVNLVRIERELIERDALVAEQIEAGNDIITLPILRTNWDNKYTFIYSNDISEDVDDWGNRIYRVYYGVKGIIGVPREEE